MISGSPSPTKATTPSAFSSEMLKFISIGCIVPVIAWSSVPSGKSAAGSVSPAAVFAAVIPAPVSLAAQAA